MVLTYEQQKALMELKHELLKKEKDQQLIHEEQEHNRKMARLNKLEEIMKLSSRDALIKLLQEVN